MKLCITLSIALYDPLGYIERIYLWSNSKIVLNWIHAKLKRCKTFIASRITKIDKLLQVSFWSHVPTDRNAADCSSRDLLPSELASHSMWWNGPRFLIEKKWEPPRFVPKEVVVNIGQVFAMRDHNHDNKFELYRVYT